MTCVICSVPTWGRAEGLQQGRRDGRVPQTGSEGAFEGGVDGDEQSAQRLEVRVASLCPHALVEPEPGSMNEGHGLTGASFPQGAATAARLHNELATGTVVPYG
jgi:hypothetical protein